MVDALVSGASAARRVGSSPILGTRFLRRTTKVARLFLYLVRTMGLALAVAARQTCRRLH